VVGLRRDLPTSALEGTADVSRKQAHCEFDQADVCRRGIMLNFDGSALGTA
jgi:hypothetical protein